MFIMMVCDKCKTGRRDTHTHIHTESRHGDERDKVVLFVGGGFARSGGGEKARDPFISSLNENGRNVSLPTAPHGIIKDRDAKDSLIRFFNY